MRRTASGWGRAFSRLPDPDGLGASLLSALDAAALAEREQALGAAYRTLATRFNALAPDLAVDATLRPFFDRPATVLGADRFAAAALDRVEDERLAALSLVGSVDQLLDSTDVLTEPATVVRMREFYAGLQTTNADSAFR
jgi:hypothetical protein